MATNQPKDGSRCASHGVGVMVCMADTVDAKS